MQCILIWEWHCRFNILIFLLTKLSMDFHYLMPSEHIEPCFVLSSTNHVLFYDVRTHKTIFVFKCVQLLFKKIKYYRFLVNPNPNPNSNPNWQPFSYNHLSWIIHNIWKLFSLFFILFFNITQFEYACKTYLVWLLINNELVMSPNKL